MGQISGDQDLISALQARRLGDVLQGMGRMLESALAAPGQEAERALRAEARKRLFCKGSEMRIGEV